ncbi:TOPRIM nucleotidyl transferase/hydrolase domain-containing protein [Pseudomonas viridiflava]|uniref:TOPRIM nucleotidyl transferase/hydrolase domain-containing protein n=1 Tax=Pseudomonas viridiflava TaxID=33069 RepID=UPI000F044E48|nr:TOPRIM nucleotidyl transferase/hydrolase domain-containing protein [Pseudomonas viridiflava]
MEAYTPYRPEIEFRKFVPEGYLGILKDCLDRVQLFKFDNLIQKTLSSFPSGLVQAGEQLLITDKFYLYKGFWQGVLERLYRIYLPHIEYEFRWIIEVTPYTILQCKLTESYLCGSDFESIERVFGAGYKDIELKSEEIFLAMDFNSLGLPVGLKGILPEELLPQSKLGQLNLLFRLMNFPPLEELSVFFMAYGAHTSKQVAELASAFPGIEAPKNLGFDLKGAIGRAWFNLDHSTFLRERLEGLETRVTGEGFEDNFKVIREISATAKSEVSDSMICPCCGDLQEVSFPEDASQFALLILDKDLSKRLGLIFFEDYLSAYKTRLRDALPEFKNSLNDVDHPKCVILVEGESEEIALPILAVKLAFDLKSRRVKIVNCKSKQKVLSQFFEYSEKFPKMKIICMLDSDAIKERDDLLRVMENRRQKYHLVFIERGCFEDLFDLRYSISVLNEIHAEGDDVSASDFDQDKDFGDNVKKILHAKKSTRLDKVRFAETISLRIPTSAIPEQIRELFEVATNFTIPKNFLAD